MLQVFSSIFDPPHQMTFYLQDLTHGGDLSIDETNVVVKTLESQNVKVDHGFVRDTWKYIFLSRFLEEAINQITTCGDISESDDLNNQQFLRVPSQEALV